MATNRPLKTLDRVLSKMGAGSRVDAQRWIRAGRVKVNGQVVRDPDRWLDMQRDRVRLDGTPLKGDARRARVLADPRPSRRTAGTVTRAVNDRLQPTQASPPAGTRR